VWVGGIVFTLVIYALYRRVARALGNGGRRSPGAAVPT
jgi:hypothetical protein